MSDPMTGTAVLLAAYLAGIPGHPPPDVMLTGITAMQGPALGVGNAVLFRALDLHAPPPIALAAMRAAGGAFDDEPGSSGRR